MNGKPTVKVHDKIFELFINRTQIHNRIAEIAASIDNDYNSLNPLIIGVLNGSFIFAADLFRNITIPVEISFIKLASYKGTSSTGNIVTAIGMEEDIHNRHVIILEDIIETGKTLHAFLLEIYHRHPVSVKIATFLTKPGALKYDVTADYTGFEIENKFVVGYGLDYDNQGRNLPDLYILKED